MAAPFFDTSLIASALRTALIPDIVLEVIDMSATGEPRRITQMPGIIISPQTTDVSGDGGAGNGRWVTELIDIVIQLSDVVEVESDLPVGLRAIRSAVWDVLEAARLSADWSELRFSSGRMDRMDDATWVWIDTYSINTGTTVAPRVI